MKTVNTPQHEYRTAAAPDTLETTGLGPCIGVALIYKSRGFVLHSPDVLMESDTADEFFALLANHIPATARKSVRPLLAGGCIDPDDEVEVKDSTSACRHEIVKRLKAAGFGKPEIKWCEPHQTHSLFLLLQKQVILLEVFDNRSKTREIKLFDVEKGWLTMANKMANKP